MPTFTKYLKNIGRENRVTTNDPGEVARLRAEGYVEEKPKRKEPAKPAVQAEAKKSSK